MAKWTLDKLHDGVMHDHSESDLGAILDSRYLKLDASNGPLTGDLTLAGAPTADLHATTKKYVDDSIAGIDLSEVQRYAFMF